MAGRAHVFSFFINAKSGRPHGVADRRDMGAAWDICRGLSRFGYAPGESLLNFPSGCDNDAKTMRLPELAIDMDFVKRGDVIIHTTRPPLTDDLQGSRKQVHLANTSFEGRLIKAWRKYLEQCSRKNVRLHRRVWRESLPEEYSDRREMKFYEREGAPYNELNTIDNGWRKAGGADENRTAAFLLRLDDMWPGGPGLVSAWGLDALVTSVWAYRLAEDFSELLSEPGFWLAELTNTGVPERPTNMRWASDWGVEILLHEPPKKPSRR